jgi:hypothetical protein
VTDTERPPVTRSRRPRDKAAAAITAAVALALGVAYVVAQRDPSTGDTEASSSTRSALAPCAAGDLVAGDDSKRLGTGTVYLTATLELVRGAEPCTVSGYPSVIVLSEGRPAGVETVTDPDLGEPEQLTVLPDRPVRVTLGWALFHYCGPVVSDAVRIWVGPDLPVEIPGFNPTSCSSGEGRQPVRVGPYTYVDPSSEQGTVRGLVTLNSGPGLGTGEFVTTGVVELAGDPDGFRAPIGPDGSYEVEVPAGRYLVTVTTHQYFGGRPYDEGPFEVVGGELNELNITLPLR